MPINEKKRITAVELYAHLENACRGLIYVSETDREVVPVFEFGGGSLSAFVQRNISEEGPIETPAADDFFRKLTTYREWHSDVDRKRVRGYRRLQRIIDANLDDVRLFRAGRVRIEIFVLGYDAEGNIAGIRTGSVET